MQWAAEWMGTLGEGAKTWWTSWATLPDVEDVLMIELAISAWVGKVDENWVLVWRGEVITWPQSSLDN